MDTTNTSSHPDHIEKTSCGVPSTADLLEEGSIWIENLRTRDLVNASDNTLTQKGKKVFFDPERNIDWVTKGKDGTNAPHPDFTLAQSVVPNETVGHPDQLRVNDLCLRLALMSCFTENQKKREGDGQYATALDEAQSALKSAYQEWHVHIHDDGGATRNPWWFQNDKPVTLRVATAAHTLSSLVMDPDYDTYAPNGQTLTDLSGEWDPTSATNPPGTNSRKSSKQASEAPGGHHHAHHSRQSEDPRSTVSRQPPGSGSAGLLGGMTIPSGSGRSVEGAKNRFPGANETKNGGNSAADVLKKRIRQSISRMAE